METGSAASLHGVHPAERVVNRVPGSLGGRYDRQYQPLVATAPPAFVLEIPQGRVVGDGVVLGPDGRLIAQVSRAIGSLRSFVSGLDQETGGHFHLASHLAGPPRRVRGKALVLATFAGRGYFHWMFDVLPRLGLAADGGIDLSEIDHFIVNNYSAGYHVETLQALGVRRGRVVSTFRNPHVVADALIVPSLAREGGVVPTWVCEFVKESFPPRPYSAAVPSTRRIYVSRTRTDHGRLPNEQRLLDQLIVMGFTPVLLEHFSMEEKAALFSRADVIVGPSGAGLTNLVFCHPETVVVEACTRGYAPLDAWDIANRVGVRYFYVPAESEAQSDETGLIVPAEDVVETLLLAGVED